MPRYSRLDIDIDAQPWRLDETVEFERAMRRPDGGEVDPSSLPSPFSLEASGAIAGALITYARGFGARRTTDVLAAPELCALLEGAVLPGHRTLDCVVTQSPLDLRTMRMKKRKRAPRPYRWYWWTETFFSRIDFGSSTFFLRHRQGPSEQARYESLEDFQQVARRAVDTLAFDIAPAVLEWNDPGAYALDLIPLGMDLFLSAAFAERVAGASLPGVRVLAPRVDATLVS